MDDVYGKFVFCHRCGTKTFVEYIGESETDGGFSRWMHFEALPDGWDQVAVPLKTSNKLRGNAYNDYMQVCPECNKLWHKVINEGFLKGTQYYTEEGAS